MKKTLGTQLMDIFLFVWLFVFNCLILPLGIGLLWLASGLFIAVFGWLDKLIIDIYKLRFTYQFLFYGISIVFGICLTIYQMKKKRNKG